MQIDNLLNDDDDEESVQLTSAASVAPSSPQARDEEHEFGLEFEVESPPRLPRGLVHLFNL